MYFLANVELRATLKYYETTFSLVRLISFVSWERCLVITGITRFLTHHPILVSFCSYVLLTCPLVSVDCRVLVSYHTFINNLLIISRLVVFEDSEPG